MRKKFVIMLAALIMLVTPLAATGTTSALFDTSKTDACNGIDVGTKNAGCTATGASFQTIIKNVINILTIIVGLAAVVMIIVGGAKYITSGGDSSKASSARTTIISAIIGLVIVALAQVIVQFVLTNANPNPAPKKTGTIIRPRGL
ncbi:MAG TPA: pilin [Candidatus Saccharimonadales bacterium]|nr:pilin [Candidatus Saccharimonadales bacterium]